MCQRQATTCVVLTAAAVCNRHTSCSIKHGQPKGASVTSQTGSHDDTANDKAPSGMKGGFSYMNDIHLTAAHPHLLCFQLILQVHLFLVQLRLL
jgi:hypothetical protein